MSSPLDRRIRRFALLASVLVAASGCSASELGQVLTPPTLTSISPSAGNPGTTAHVKFAGANFVAGATSVELFGAPRGVTVTGVNVESPSTLSADIVVAKDAEIGARILYLTTPSGKSSGIQNFFVLPPFQAPAIPTLAAVTPSTFVQGSTNTVTLTGTNFVSGATSVAVTLPGVTVSNVSVTSETSLTATLTVDLAVPVGPGAIAATTPVATTLAKLFFVTGLAPAFDAVTPNVGAPGTTTRITVGGANFSPGAEIVVLGGGVTVSDVVVVSSKSITARVDIATNADSGMRLFFVRTVGGVSPPQQFTVTPPPPPPPTLTSVSPSAGAQGQAVNTTLTGTNFAAGATSVAVSGPGVTVSDVNVVSPTALTATIRLDASALVSGRAITVTTPTGTSAPLTFNVLPPAPTLSAITPVVGIRTSVVPVTLTGANFIAGATTVTVSGDGVNVDSVRVVSGTSLTAVFTLSATATVSDRNVTVTTAGGTSNGKAFTVLAPTPRITSIASDAGTPGTTTRVTINGANFVADRTSVAVSGTGVTASNVSVTNAATLTVDLAIGTGAPLGARSVTVTVLGRTSNAVTFTVNASGLTLTSISPATGAQGSTVAVTLTGSGFLDTDGSGGANVFVPGGNVVVSNINVVSDNLLTATFTIGGSAALGPRNITVSNAGVVSNPKTFTIVP